MEKSRQIIPSGDGREKLPEVTIGYIEVLFGLRQPEQLARWLTDKFYTEVKYRARRELMARQVTGLVSRPTIGFVTSHIGLSAENTLEMVTLVRISGRILSVTTHSRLHNGRQRVCGIDLLWPTS